MQIVIYTPCVTRCCVDSYKILSVERKGRRDPLCLISSIPHDAKYLRSNTSYDFIEHVILWDVLRSKAERFHLLPFLVFVRIQVLLTDKRETKRLSIFPTTPALLQGNANVVQ